MKKLLALLLAVVMVVCVFAGCQPTTPGSSSTPSTPTTPSTPDPLANIVEWTGDYTYTDWVTTLSANWNPHTYQTNDESYPISFLAAGLYDFIFNDALNPVEGKEEYEGYVIIPEMAAGLPVDVTEAVKAAHPEFNIPSDQTAGFAYTIDLNQNATFQDGTKITAKDYVESMKRLLDPKLQNYRAGGYYESSFCIAGAEFYANQGNTVTISLGSVIKNEGLADMAALVAKYGDAKAFINWKYSFGAKIDYTTGEATAPENKVVDAEKSLKDMLPWFVDAAVKYNGATEEVANEWAFDELYIEWTYPSNVEYSTVGLYESGEYQITLVLGRSMAGFNLLYNLTSNWLVKTDLYDACLKETDGVWTSTYNTSVETTCSYGPYKMTDYQTDKGMHFAKNENWYGHSDKVHVYQDPVDGKIYRMYQTSEIDTQVVAEVATAKMMFLKGELMTYGLQSEDFADYRDSEWCHFSPGQSTFFIILNGNMPAIQQRESAEDFDKSKFDLEMLTLTSFHRAMGLTYDKSKFIETQIPSDSPAFGLIGNAYIYDPASGATYRSTDAAKKVLCEVYSVDTTKFESLDDAVASITGYDPIVAKEWYNKAYTEGIEKGYITDADNDGKCDQTIEITYATSGAVSEKLTKRLDYMSDEANKVTEGTPFEGKIKFVPSAPLGNAWSDNVKAGLVDTVLGGWTGSMMDPFGLIEVYTNPAYQYDAAWWDSTTVDMTLTIDGKEITMNLDEWTKALNGVVVEKDGVQYNFGEGQTAADNRLAILAGIEKQVLLTYNYLPLSEEGSMALLSKKAFYIIEDYNPVLGRGGIAYLRYNYDDAAWAAYVAEQGDAGLSY